MSNADPLKSYFGSDVSGLLGWEYLDWNHHWRTRDSTSIRLADHSNDNHDNFHGLLHRDRDDGPAWAIEIYPRNRWPAWSHEKDNTIMRWYPDGREQALCATLWLMICGSERYRDAINQKI